MSISEKRPLLDKLSAPVDEQGYARVDFDDDLHAMQGKIFEDAARALEEDIPLDATFGKFRKYGR